MVASATPTIRNSFRDRLQASDGGAFQQGYQTAKSAQMVAAYTHVFSPSVVNQARAGFAHLHTTRFGPVATQAGIPGQYGISGIPQPPTAGPENGGLPGIVISNLQTLGSNEYLPSDEATATVQFTDDFTRNYGKHSFKMGFEFQNAKFSTLQPVASRGYFQYNGTYTDIPNQGATRAAGFLLTPAPFAAGGYTSTTLTNGYDYSGGSQSVTASTSTRPTTRRNTWPSTSRTIGRYFEDDPENLGVPLG